ncbi:MAG: alkaline phosphatase family protein [Phycisphaerae bacterium]|nr:alkaline phosphatase family protein [Phycisphaerae bacterium]
MHRFGSLLAFVAALVVAASFAGLSARPVDAVAENVVVVMIDGLRWQDVFRGASDALLTKERGKVASAEAVLATYGGADRAARRAALMPFFWSTIATEGTILGNRDEGSKVEVTNGRFVSYPGYSETICGIVDPAFVDNTKIVNPNRNVFEALAARDDFRGKVYVFGAWEVFPFIFGSARNGLPVDDSIGPFVPPPGAPAISERIAAVNDLRVNVPRRWPGGHFDAMVTTIALEWIRIAKPRVVFVGLGETDEWAHEGDYANYLAAAHRADRFLADLWSTLQAMPEYRGRTTLLVTCDHGRGNDDAGPLDWCSHNARTVGSHEMWCAALGPAIPARGVVRGGPTVGQAQIAATIARAVGLDWQREVPAAAPPIAWDAAEAAAPTSAESR